MRFSVSPTLMLSACAAIMCAAPVRAQDQNVYADSLQNGWQNWSWCSVDYNSKTVAAHSGSASTKVTYTGGWQAFYLHHDAFSGLAYNTLTFWIHGGATAGRTINIAAIVNNTGTAGISLNKFIEGGSVTANAWSKVTVPLSALGVDKATNITGFWLQEYSGKAQAAFYVDDISLVAGANVQVGNGSVDISVDANANRHAINPFVYGVAYGSTTALTDLNCPLNRLGGNNTSRYNWTQNADNRGSDWYFESIGDASAVPGERGDTFIKNSKQAGAEPMLTIPTVGYVAKLGASRAKLSSYSIAKYGKQKYADSYMKDAGNGVAASNGLNITWNNPLDANTPSDSLFQQTWVQHITSVWGLASNGGLKYYILDNEPSIWHSTHRDVHHSGAFMKEIRDKTIDYAAKIKAVDPQALVVGPEEWGWTGYFYSGADQQYGSQHGWSNLPDRKGHNNADYLPWLLDQLRANDAATGVRSLDVFSLHFYPQGGEFSNDVSSTMQLRRNQSTRALWDPTYVDKTWINDKVQLIPRMKNWVAAYYPGLQTAITEYNWGAESHINGATTQADILGIFGREGLDMANRWTAPTANTPTYNAFKLYRNYDGSHSTFGDVSVADSTANPDNVASFASVRSTDGALTIMVISKGLTGTTPVNVNLANFLDGGKAQVWQLTVANVITHLADTPIVGGKTQLTVPSQSITLLVIPHG